MSGGGLRERITAKLADKGVDDLLAMLRGIRAQDTEALRAEVETLTAQLLALAVERRADLGERVAAALVKAARTVRADAEPDAFAFLGEEDEEDSLEEFLIADLVGLGHQVAGAVGTQEPEEGAALLRLSSRLMAAGAMVLEATGDAPAPETERIDGWLQLATAEAIVRRLAGLLEDAFQDQRLGLPKDEDDRWATAAVILSGGLPPVADALRAERGRYRETLLGLDPHGWVRLIASTLEECAAVIAPALDAAPSPGLEFLLNAARSWAQVAAAEDGTEAIARASSSGGERADG